MLIQRRRGWEIPEREATPERFFLNRREMLAGGIGAAGALASGGLLAPAAARADTPDPSAKFYPAKRNGTYTIERPLTPEKVATHYNNFYEFGTDKSIFQDAQKLVARPWTISIGGMVEKPFDIDFDDLLKKVQLEERLYRLRCVEAWSMTIPWTGFAMKQLVALARPLSGAKYVQLETFKDPKIAIGQRQIWYPWPYVEGCTIAEAGNDLAFLVTGAYGKPLPKQNGAPIRLHMPWKYGFKGIKSIRRITFTDKRPKSFWEALQASEYGFWANVNPAVSHPRWSQATETVVGENRRIPTQLYNGYAEYVADLYKGLEKTEKLYM